MNKPPFLPDVIKIDKTSENFRLIFDVKGRFAIHRIQPEEAKVGFHYIDLKLQYRF